MTDFKFGQRKYACSVLPLPPGVLPVQNFTSAQQLQHRHKATGTAG